MDYWCISCDDVPESLCFYCHNVVSDEAFDIYVYGGK